jgi:hypothetical protein
MTGSGAGLLMHVLDCCGCGDAGPHRVGDRNHSDVGWLEMVVPTVGRRHGLYDHVLNTPDGLLTPCGNSLMT